MCFFVTKSELLAMSKNGHIHPEYFTEIMDEIKAINPEELISVRGEFYNEDYCSLNVTTLPADSDTRQYAWSYITVSDWLAGEVNSMSEADKPVIGCCDWCHAVDVEIKAARGMDEGSNGSMHDVCIPCIKKQNALCIHHLQ